MSALLKIDQTGLSAGVAGVARTDGKADGSRVTLTNTGSGGSTVFRLLWTPPGDTTSSATLVPTGDPKIWQFDPTPNVYGSWLVELVQNEGLQTEIRERRVFGVRSFAGFLIPAANERGDKDASLVLATSAQAEASNNNAIDFPSPSLNARPWASWWRALHEMFSALDRFAEVVCVADFMTVAERLAAYNGSFAVDHQPSIQRAVDHALYRTPNAVGFSTGRKLHLGGYLYRIDRPIHVGYGENDFRGVEIVGEGKREGGTYDGGGAGTVIRAMHSDAPALCIQGARGTVIRGITFYGPNFNHVVATIVQSAPAMSHLQVNTWIDPTLAPNAGSRWAPNAAIAIDPYTGPQPTPHYPDVAYPAFVGASGQYNKGQSRDVQIVDVTIKGFVVGIVQHPGDADGNGDYTLLDRVNFWFCAYGFSWGNSQARVNELRHCVFSYVHTAIASSVHGLQAGMPQVTLTACAFETGVSHFEMMNLGYGQGPTFVGCYSEAMYTLGRCNGVSRDSGSLKFLGCEFGFTWWNSYGVPVWVLEMEGSMQARFENVFFYLPGVVPAFLNIRASGSTLLDEPARAIAFEGCMTNLTEIDGEGLYMKAAHNATMGLTISKGSTCLDRFSCKSGWLHDLDTGAHLPVGGVLHSETAVARRNVCAPVYAKRLKSLIQGNDVGVPVGWQTYGFLIDTVVSTVGRLVTFTFADTNTAYLMHFGGDVGDVFVSGATGAAFVVRSRTGMQLTMEAMSGFDKDGNLLNGIVPGGLLHPINCRRYMLSAVLYGDLTAGSPTVTNLTLGNGSAPGDLSAILTANDYLYVDQEVDQAINPFDGSARLVSFDTGARTATFAGSFNYSQARRRFGVFVRPALPNVP